MAVELSSYFSFTIGMRNYDLLYVLINENYSFISFVQKISVKNVRIKTNNHVIGPEIRFLAKSNSKLCGR